MPEPSLRLSPKTDIVFKLLFAGSEPILIGLLEAVLRPPTPIRSAEVKNPELPRDFFDEKGSYLDILVQLDDGTLLDVEMQCARHDAFRERALYYWASVYSSQLEAGHDYGALGPVISILFLDYREFASQQFHQVFQLRSEQEVLFSAHAEIHTVELPKVPAPAVTARGPDAALLRWSRFLTSDNPLELAELAAQDPLIAMAEDRLAHVTADPATRELALERQRRLAGYHIEMAGARAAGIAEGRAEGEAAGHIAGQKQLLVELLEARFGVLPSAAANALDLASPEQVIRWASRLLTAESLDELFER